MTRRLSKATRRARWTLLAGITPGAAAMAYSHEAWAGAAACLAAWTLLATGAALLRRKPKPRPRPTPTNNAPTEQDPHVLYAAWLNEHQTTLNLGYIGVCSIHPSRNVVNRILEHARTETAWWPAIHHVTPRAYYPDEQTAKRAEARAIHTATAAGAPLHNKTHITHQLADCPTLRASPHPADAP